MDETQTTNEATEPDESPSMDLADLGLGSVLFVSGAFLLLEIGGAIAATRSTLPAWLQRSSSGALTVDAIIAAIEIGLVIAILAMERVHPVAAGLRFRLLPRAILLGVAIWGLCQLSLAIVSLGRHGTISLYVGWTEPAAMIAPLLQRFLTDVLAEEIFWRAVFFVWIIRVLESRAWRDPLTRLSAALLASQILFGITRLPSQILERATALPPGMALVVSTLTGMFYALIYLRTGNIWLVMFVHALALWPAPALAFDIDPSKLTILVAAVLLIPTGGDLWRPAGLPRTGPVARSSR